MDFVDGTGIWTVGQGDAPLLPPPPPPPEGGRDGGRFKPLPPHLQRMLLRGLLPEIREEEEVEILEIIDLLDLLDNLPIEKEMETKSQADYGVSLRAIVRGLWQSEDLSQFTGDMLDAVDRNLSQAWFAGMKACGILPSEISDEEERARTGLILESLNRITGFGEDILAGKKAGKKVSDFFSRVKIWANRWNEAFTLAKAMACADQKEEWILGPTEEHCEDCAKYNGRVHRNSMWIKWATLPQSRKLSCSGYNCLCELVPTDKPALPGRPPSPTG